MPSRTIPARTKIDFWLDLVLALAFICDYSFRFTGLTLHEWIGMGLGVSLLVHLALHWEWVVRTSSRIFGSLPGRERVRWTANLGLVIAMTLCIASGVLISRVAMKSLGITVAGGGFWRGLHTTSADVCVALVGVHVALDWKWIVTVVKRMFQRRATASAVAQ